MECNKEEAIRAKEIAQKRMMSKDFPGALKIVLRAQQLYHDLDNISQMLMVCEVHCTAEKRIFGNEMDWYGILQIGQTADEAAIKKQYRKFAFQLHPDKNKFPGAEAAFKLIGEAHRVLLDQSKRSAYDMKCRVTLGRPAPTAAARQPQRPSWNPHVSARTNFCTNFPNSIPQQKKPAQQSQQAQTNGRPTFWTKCPYCTVKYKNYTDILHSTLRCQTCDKSFTAYDLGAAPQPTDPSQPKVPKQKDVQNQGAQNVKQGFHENLCTENSKATSSSKVAHDSQVGIENANGKRGKRSVASSESCHTQSSSRSEDDILIDERSNVQAGKDVKCPRENLRRSGRHKQEVSYRENLSDDEDLVNPPKRAKGSSSSNATEEDGNTHREETLKINNLANGKKEAEKLFGQETAEGVDPKKCSEAHADGGKMNFTADSKSNLIPQSSQERALHSYPDPDFNDFDKDRKVESFAVRQIWAVYDTLDAMPRFYVQIRKVFSPRFKLRITWLEPDPDDVNEIKWVDEGLPVSCGKFKYGDSENTEDHLMFSHLMYWEKGTQRDTFKVLPRKGETWALFKNWDIKWNSDAVSNRKFEYEFVEILSEYADSAGIHVACLVKVKGFVSLFCRMMKDGIDAFQIPPGELFRFSHRVPSFKLTGTERKGVPKGSFELDPASLATNLEEIDVPEDSCSRSPRKVKRKIGSGKSNDKQGLEVGDVPQISVDVNGKMNSRIMGEKEINHSDRSNAVLPASVDVDFTLHKSLKDKRNPSVCIPVNCVTPINAASPVCMDNEYLTLSCKKKLSRTSLLFEIQSHNPSDLEPISPLKGTRKGRDLADIRVTFSDHLDDNIIKQQRKILVSLGIPEVSSIIDATHFVADKFVRTRNMLEAMASGKLVVTHLWLERVGQANRHIDEKTYILRDIKKEKEFGFCMPVSLARAQKHGLLEGRRVFITPNTKPGKDIISSLVKAVHGKAVERIGRSVLKDDKIPDDMLVLSCEEDYALCVPFLEKGAEVYSSELLLNGIVTQRLDYERHCLFAEQVKRTRSTIFLKSNDKFLPVTKLK
ncbi:hypothetical protein SLEP1_g46878 [Rubroshorea leprosula]|uniref:J domain-containing protein n=1 Tax=Rubroshorea leprosula TaxID=152421 RepID=A0AAV5LNN3_9ROSI|nr:hypothetical protein SLEP1_g46878 [Rubroshorea leprosula]